MSSGSPDWNTDDSKTQGPRSTATEMTPIAMWVESSVWWLSGATEFSAAEGRCMKAPGPSAGSPTGAPANVMPVLSVERNAPGDGRLHQEVVRMLTIDERDETVRLSGLKQLAIAARAGRRAIEARHAGQRQPARAGLAARHSHEPVGRDELVAAPRPGLMAERSEEHAVVHQHPR